MTGNAKTEAEIIKRCGNCFAMQDNHEMWWCSEAAKPCDDIESCDKYRAKKVTNTAIK